MNPSLWTDRRKAMNPDHAPESRAMTPSNGLGAARHARDNLRFSRHSRRRSRSRVAARTRFAGSKVPAAPCSYPGIWAQVSHRKKPHQADAASGLLAEVERRVSECLLRGCSGMGTFEGGAQTS